MSFKSLKEIMMMSEEEQLNYHRRVLRWLGDQRKFLEWEKEDSEKN